MPAQNALQAIVGAQSSAPMPSPICFTSKFAAVLSLSAIMRRSRSRNSRRLGSPVSESWVASRSFAGRVLTKS